MSIVCLTTYYNAVDAHVLKIKLENEGIACFIANDTFMFSGNSAVIQVMINEQDLDKAKEIALSLAPVVEHICPKCNSSNAKPIHKSNFDEAIDTLLVGLGLMSSRKLRQVYLCKDCHTKFV